MLPWDNWSHGYKIYFIDLEREKEINIGVDWSTDLAPDECIITTGAAHTYRVNIGDTLTF